jgi:hypothetical protein
VLGVTTFLPVSAETAAAQAAQGAARNVIQTTDYGPKRRPVFVDPSRKWSIYGVNMKAHWLLELKDFSPARLTHF